MVIVDEYSKDGHGLCSLPTKMSFFEVFFKFYRRIQNEKAVCITSIKRDHGGEFENENFHLLCEENGILHNFLTPRTP